MEVIPCAPKRLKTLIFLVVPPKNNRKEPWEYDRGLYKRRNEIERYLLRVKKRFRGIFTRYDKLDVLFSGFIFLAMSVDCLM